MVIIIVIIIIIIIIIITTALCLSVVTGNNLCRVKKNVKVLTTLYHFHFQGYSCYNPTTSRKVLAR